MIFSFVLIAVGVVYAQLPKSSECDSFERTGTAVVAEGTTDAKTCMEGKESAEDRWFKENVCGSLWVFEKDPAESATQFSEAQERECERVRSTWLGNFSALAKEEADLTGQRKPTAASELVDLIEGQVSWFDSKTPIGNFSQFAFQSSCSSRPSSRQDESHFYELFESSSAGDALPFAECGASKPALLNTLYNDTLAGAFTYLMDTVYQEWHTDGDQFDGSSAAPVMRKDLRTLSNADRIRYLDALRITECLGMTKLWGAIHASSPADMHSGPGFLPSHSIFMRIYELSLQRFGGLGDGIGLHIVGWPVDETLPRWHNGRIRFSSIWGDDYIGPIAEQSIGFDTLESSSAQFPEGHWRVESRATRQTTLSRSFRNVERRGGFLSAEHVWRQMSIEDPMEFACELESSLLHGGMHMVIGGFMGNLLAASNDAAFFMHHGFVDCLWRNWQMQKEERGRADFYPETPSWWSRHNAGDTAHWTRWVSPANGGATVELTHADATHYKSRGAGADQCLIPSLLPCSTDEDCGVPAGTARADKRLYCSALGTCSQYVDTNAICRNEIGSFLPCQKPTDRCQLSASLYAKLNPDADGAPAEDDPSAWFCVPSPALECGAHRDASTCAADSGNACRWVEPSTSDVQTCEFNVPAFGFGVVESSIDTMQAFGATFDFRSPTLQDPQDSASAATWSVSDAGVSATLRAVRMNSGALGFEYDDNLELYRNRLGFGVSDKKASSNVLCEANSDDEGGDYPAMIDRSEGIEIAFAETVAIERLRLSRFGSADVVEVQLMLNNEVISIQRYADKDVVFGASNGEIIQACTAECLVDALVVYHRSAVDPAFSSVHGEIDDEGECVRVNRGAAFSLDSVVVTASKLVEGMPSGTPSSFAGYCTGAPGGDYTHCSNTDRCFISPAQDSATREVQVILVPAGECGPRGWYPQIGFVQEANQVVANYLSECPCGINGAVLTGNGPSSDTSGKNFRPMFDLYRQQDRLAGNDDAFRRASDSATMKIAITTIAMIVAMLL